MLAILALIMCSTVSVAQQNPPTNQQVANVLVELHSQSWSQRAQAYEQLRHDQAAMRNPEVKAALIDLLDRENQSRRSGESGTNSSNSEDYAEYIASLVDTVDSVADWTDQRQLCILAHSPFDPDSRFARKLALTGQVLMTCLTQMSQSTSSADRYQAVALLVQMRAKFDNLSPETRQRINQITITALHDPDEMVRVGAVHSLGNYGKEDMIPALTQVANEDPAPEVQGHSIRRQASKAITAIQARRNK